MSASATPAPLTRWPMMFFASFSWSAVTEPLPATGFAVSVMVVPPRRSSPSLGFQVLVSAMIPNSRTTMTARAIRFRPGGMSSSLPRQIQPSYFWARRNVEWTPGAAPQAVGTEISSRCASAAASARPAPCRRPCRVAGVRYVDRGPWRSRRIAGSSASSTAASSSGMTRPTAALTTCTSTPSEISSVTYSSSVSSTMPTRPLVVITLVPGAERGDRLCLPAALLTLRAAHEPDHPDDQDQRQQQRDAGAPGRGHRYGEELHRVSESFVDREYGRPARSAQARRSQRNGLRSGHRGV